MKMINISNKTIAILLVVVMIITISGTLISINRLVHFSESDWLTGAAVNTTTGTATITVLTITQITNRVPTINFGTGYVNETNGTDVCPYCQMDTITGISPGNVSCCALFNNVTAGFLLENTGTENMSVNFSCVGSCNASTFINGSLSVHLFQFKMTNGSDALNRSGDSVNDTSGSCSSGGGWNYTDWSNVSNAGSYLCGGNTTNYFFDKASASDAAIFDLRVRIPPDARTNIQQTANFTFSGNSIG
ncbi:hypothetical protein J4444_00825 [Candidatus Woesearchaeota archaeon]|nr:hypothetical protein [Candidatus Woesearchaeota archaeon]